MLNALIAIMGDSYDRVSDTRKERGQQQRAELLVEMERRMLVKRPEYFGRWLHGVRRVAKAAVKMDEWSGRLRVLKDEVANVMAKATEMDAKMDAKMKEMKAEMKEMKAEMKEMKAEMKVEMKDMKGVLLTLVQSVRENGDYSA